MKLIELFEDKTSDLAEIIRRDCAPYLKLPGSSDVLLFRGVTEKYDMQTYVMPKTGRTLYWTVFERRKDRQPAATRQDFSEIADSYFQKNFGWKARSEGVFVTGNATEASGYGDLFVVVPMGPTRFVWSPQVFDLYNETIVLGNRWTESTPVQRQQADFEEFLNNADYRNNGLVDAVTSHNEIMFDCDRYLAISATVSGRHEPILTLLKDNS